MRAARIELISRPKLVGLGFLAIALLCAFGALTSLLVSRSAEETAGAQPYCIQISDGISDYRPARSWLDLSAFAMRARRDGNMYMQHHAILVVGTGANPQLFHWTYRHSAFEPGVINGKVERSGPAITCTPVHGFAATLGFLLSKAPDDSYISYSGRETYRIPNIWQPKWRGGTTPALTLGATAPDFQPLNQRWDDLQSSERDYNWLFITWDPEWLLSVMSTPSRETIVERGMEFGLTKQTSITRGSKDGKGYTGYRYFTYGDGRAINVTLIECSMPSEAAPKSCQHRFINNAKHVTLRHRLDEVADWKGMQQRVIALMDEFEVHEAK